MISFWKIYVYCYNYKWAKPCVFVLFVNRQFLKLSALTPPKWQQMNWALNQSSAVESKGKSNKVHLSLLPLIGGNGASNERYLSTLAHEVIPNIHILKRRIYYSQFRKQPSQRVLNDAKNAKAAKLLSVCLVYHAWSSYSVIFAEFIDIVVFLEVMFLKVVALWMEHHFWLTHSLT